MNVSRLLSVSEISLGQGIGFENNTTGICNINSGTSLGVTANNIVKTVIPHRSTGIMAKLLYDYEEKQVGTKKHIKCLTQHLIKEHLIASFIN